MSSPGKRPKNIFFICDRKKCSVCDPKCTHTRDINHAIRPEGEFKKNLQDGSMWQTALSTDGRIIRG